MKTVTNNFHVSINAQPETVFAYVSDLSRHGEWNSGLRIEAVTPGPVSAGSLYRSWGKPGNRLNEIKITDYQPPTQFTFVAHDSLVKDVTHKFAVNLQGNESLVERVVTAHWKKVAPLLRAAGIENFFFRFYRLKARSQALRQKEGCL